MSTTWYLRTDQGVIFGPAGISILREWAEQGRIGPESQLSDDRNSWVPAHTLAELEMNWLFDLGNGMIGPVNLRALRDLVLDGVVPSTTLLVHRQTQTKHPLFQKLDQVFGKPATPAQSMPPPAGGATPDTATNDQTAKLATQLQQAAEQNASLSAELKTARDLLQKERRLAELKQREIHQAVQQAENSRTAAASALKAETSKAEEYRRQLESAGKLVDQARAESAAAGQQLQQLQQEQAKAARRQSEADEQWRLSEAELRRTLDAERAAATAARKNATDQAESFQAMSDAWHKTEKELRGELCAAADALVRAKADIDRSSSNHSLQAERWSQSEEKLRKALEAAQAELGALRTEKSAEERRLRSALDESTRELTHVRNSLRTSETAHASAQVLRVELDRLVQRIAELEARATQLASERDDLQTRLMTLIQEAGHKKDEPASGQPRPSSDRPEVHEPEILPPLSSAPPPHPDIEPAQNERPAQATRPESPWSREFGRRAAGKSDSKSATMADIEAQAQRDILAWQKGKTPPRHVRNTHA